MLPLFFSRSVTASLGQHVNAHLKLPGKFVELFDPNAICFELFLSFLHSVF